MTRWGYWYQSIFCLIDWILFIGKFDDQIQYPWFGFSCWLGDQAFQYHFLGLFCDFLIFCWLHSSIPRDLHWGIYFRVRLSLLPISAISFGFIFGWFSVDGFPLLVLRSISATFNSPFPNQSTESDILNTA